MSEHVVEFTVPLWEIHCCRPPIVVGLDTTWSLTFHPGDHPLARDDRWTAVPDGHRVLLRRPGVEAGWVGADPPPPGEGVFRGHLAGTQHGGGGAPVTGRVRRLRVVAHQYEDVPGPPRGLRRLPGTLRMYDRLQSPDPVPDADWDLVDEDDEADGAGPEDEAVLVEMTVELSP